MHGRVTVFSKSMMLATDYYNYYCEIHTKSMMLVTDDMRKYWVNPHQENTKSRLSDGQKDIPQRKVIS